MEVVKDPARVIQGRVMVSSDAQNVEIRVLM